MMGEGERLIFGDILLESKGSFAVVTINREAKRNAVNRSGRQNLLRAFEHARERFPVVILTGVGTVFCAGVDLKERADDIAKADQSATQEWINVNVAIREHPAVFIAAVNGLALGGGLTLINVCDLAIAADTIELGMPEMGFSTYPGMAGPSTQLSLSRKRVAWMMFTTDRISANTALEWGLLNKCVPAAQLMQDAEATALRVSKFNPIALAAAKQALDQIPSNIRDWRQAFQFGELVNAKIQLRNANANPFAQALPNGGEKSK
jgi:enoyl-CoA hydratase/carnithine racemase